jgi:hypothetical protein
MKEKRDRKSYQAHILRQDVIHSSEDGMVVLLGKLALEPGANATFTVEYPWNMASPPQVTVRFVPKDRFVEFIQDCQEGELDVPPNFDLYPAPQVEMTTKQMHIQLEDNRPGRFIHRWQAWLKTGPDEPFRDGIDIGLIKLRFGTDPGEGAYVFVVESEMALPGASARFHDVVHNRAATAFPTTGVEDLADIIVPAVNLNPKKHGIIWFVHPIYFTEQILRIALGNEVKTEIVECEGLPDDLPAEDEVLVRLQWGYRHIGLDNIRLAVDAPADQCLDLSPIQVVNRTVELKNIIERKAQ